MSHRRSPSPIRTLSLWCCQIKAWKAGHKSECTAAARADTRTPAKPTADQMRVLKILEQLDSVPDWRGVAAQERAARTVAAAVRTSMPNKAAWVYCTLGRAYRNLGNFSEVLEHHKDHLTMAKEVGDRAGWVRRMRTSASRMIRLGTMPRPSSTTGSAWRSQRRWSTGRGRARRTGTSVSRISRRVT
jgi:hypothetical protein